MLRVGGQARLTGCLKGVAVLALSAIALAGSAAAATAAQSAGPGGQFSAKSMLAPPARVTSAYSCDLSGYGTGLTPVTFSGTLSVPATVVADSRTDVAVVTTASTALPAAVVTALAGVKTFDIATTVTAKQGTFTSTPALSGSATAPTTLTTLPILTALGSVDFPSDPNSTGFPESGTGTVTAPAATLTITPHTATAALAAITCTTTAATQDITITVTPETIGTTGPLYSCVYKLLGISFNKQFWHVPSTITTSGSATTGKKLTVTYQTNAFNDFPGGPLWGGADSVNYSSSLPVTGAQPGNVSVDQALDVNASTLKVSGTMPLTKAGTDRIEVPKTFTLTIVFTPESGTGTVTLDFICTLTGKTTPVGRTIAVKKASTHPHPRPTTTVTVTATPSQGVQGGGTPTGAPNTGGGIGSVGGGLGMALAGLGVAGAGGGLVFGGWRLRRRRS
jgi:hypothetical protein